MSSVEHYPVVHFKPDPDFPPRVPEMHTDLYEQDMMRYDHIALWNRPVWRSVPRMPTHVCKSYCVTCYVWQMADEKPTIARINALNNLRRNRQIPHWARYLA